MSTDIQAVKAFCALLLRTSVFLVPLIVALAAAIFILILWPGYAVLQLFCSSRWAASIFGLIFWLIALQPWMNFMRRFPEESSDLPPGPWLKAGSWTLAIFYCVASFLIGRINSVMAGIYHDLGVPLDWPQVFVTHLRLPVTLTAGILTAIALIFKDQWLSADSIKRCNAAAAISLVCLGCSCVITALSPHWGPHELIHK